MMKGSPSFILIDDNFINGYIAEKILKGMGLKDSITSFMDANKALEYIRTNRNEDMQKTILLVDLQMPMMSGFSFLEVFEQLPSGVRNHYAVYIVTSSINQEDQRQAYKYPSVKRFLSKPLTASIVQEIIDETYS